MIKKILLITTIIGTLLSFQPLLAGAATLTPQEKHLKSTLTIVRRKQQVTKIRIKSNIVHQKIVIKSVKRKRAAQKKIRTTVQKKVTAH